MRISSTTMLNYNVSAINQLQSQIAQTQEQAAGGTQLLSAATDPAAYTTAMNLNQTVAINTQQGANITSATNTLSIAGNTMMSVTNLLQSIRGIAVTAQDPTLSDAARSAIATNLNGQLQQLVGLANSTDGVGNYLFSGFQSKTTPFTINASGVTVYNGDAGQQSVQVSAGRQIPVNDSGSSVFMNIKNGNGTFSATASAANTGGGVISAGLVTNSAQLTSNTYSIKFAVAAGVTTYTVTPPPTVGAASGTYTPGQAISFDGMQVSISGAPANGDSFTLAPSTNQSVFQTISNMITTLKTPALGANVVNGIANGILNIDNAIQHMSTVEASQGLRLNEMSLIQTSNNSMNVQLQQTLSSIQDTNYASTLTALSQQQLILQAAQKSYAQVANLSMFSYM